jgi:hypothetical protein
MDRPLALRVQRRQRRGRLGDKRLLIADFELGDAARGEAPLGDRKRARLRRGIASVDSICARRAARRIAVVTTFAASVSRAASSS